MTNQCHHHYLNDIDGVTYCEHCGDCPTEREQENLCPVCGDPIDYCQGHGEIGDPVGFLILQNHDSGDHSQCFKGSDCHV